MRSPTTDPYSRTKLKLQVERFIIKMEMLAWFIWLMLEANLETGLKKVRCARSLQSHFLKLKGKALSTI